MIQVKVKNLNGELKYEAKFKTLGEANAWIAQSEGVKLFGKPDRWVYEDDLKHLFEDKSKAIASQDIGGPDEQFKKYKFAADYSIVVTDITDEITQRKINADSLAYLCSTDWMILRFLESGKAVPIEVTVKRTAARAAIVAV